MTIHAELKAARLAQGLSMEQLAREISKAEKSAKPLAWQTIQQWEAGKSAPKRTRLDLVKKILGMQTQSMAQSMGPMTQDMGASYLPTNTTRLPSAYSAVMEIASLINGLDKPARAAIGSLLSHLCENPDNAELTARRINALLGVQEMAEAQRSTR
ncbi:helix-turn-helix domain-containing protein [Acidovorax sp. LjRoot118]|uniref:helix-turn-helix domain-containing protein n=1 Tax=Acidovorax sp. LjRoot118 TaxID=3342256 RepID=UPI003ED07C63